MNLDRLARGHSLALVGALSLLVLVSACGGGGDSAAGTPPPDSAPPAPTAPVALSLPVPAAGSGTLVAIASSSGDTLGAGRSATFTLANSDISVVAVGASLRLTVRGDDFWDATIRTSATGTTVVEGLHSGLRENPAGIDDRVGMDWQRERTLRCGSAEALLSVDRVRYIDGVLAEVDLRMAQRCTGDSGVLQAQVRWVAAERPVRSPAPAAPATLWRPASGSVPDVGNVVFIESAGSEAVFEGRSRRFTEDDAVIRVGAAGDRIEIELRGSDTWYAQLRGIDRPQGLQPGFYDGLRGFIRGHNPARGALEWYRGIAMCPGPRGWFALDRLQYERGALVAIEFRFEQRCLEQAGVVRGLVRWDASARRLPPAPGPAPVGAWAPESGSVPHSGNHLLLVSAPGEPLAEGRTRLFSDSSAGFLVFDNAGTLTATITDNMSGAQWRANFRSRVTAGRFEGGYRGPLGASWNPAIGGMQVGGEGRGCTLGSGWFAVDAVSHRHGVLRHVALRFEFQCEGGSVPLRGSLRWTSDDPNILSGPADLPLAEPAIPASPVMPADGSAALFESRGFEFIGQGRDWLYTPGNAVLQVRRIGTAQAYIFDVDGDEPWSGTITLPSGQTRLQTGRHEIAWPPPDGRLGFLVGAMGRGCQSNGWFEILRSEYSGDELSGLELRFEQFCDDSPYPLLGHFRWRADDTAVQPVQPQAIPAGLWQSPVGALPAGSNSVYIQSNPGGFVGDGQTRLVQPSPQDAMVEQLANGLSFTFAQSASQVSVRINLPQGEPLLRPGFYPGTTRATNHPLRMGVSLSVDGRGCNEQVGWLAVDDVAYDALGLLRIALRLQQVCDGLGPPAMAALQWSRP